MAAQPLVRLSYKDPVLTYETNVLGTVNVLEAARLSQTVRSVLNVTTDKVYKNIEIQGGYKETDELMGRDPYSNSKSCSELLTYSYKKSFFDNSAISVSTARSGNVIGGGDFAADRIIPDAVRAIEKNKPLILRYPNSIRPYQHVIESLFAYLLIACKQYGNKKFEGSCNIGPDLADCICSKDLIDLFFAHFAGAKYKVENNNEPYESKFLRLDTQKMKEVFLWKPLINIKEAVEMTAEWTKVYLENGDIAGFMDSQICKYRKLARGIFA
jgi:CDP-glucose 4,6-dehydratase